MNLAIAGRGPEHPGRGTVLPRFGVMNSPLRPLSAELQRIVKTGFDFMELAMDAPMADAATVRAHAQEIRDRICGAGMGLVCHLPTFVYTTDPCDAIRQASLLEMHRAMEAAAELGAAKAVLHPSPFSGLGPALHERTLDRCRENLEKAVHHAAELGLPLCLENMIPRYRAFYRPQEFAAPLAAHAALMLTLDVGHANLVGEGDVAKTFIERFASRIGHLHFSDNGGQRDDHLPVGEGTVDFDSIVGQLVRAGYRGTLTLEIFTDVPGDLESSRQRIAELWVRYATGKNPAR